MTTAANHKVDTIIEGTTSVDRRSGGLIVAWVLALVALPILIWTAGDTIIPAAVTGALALQFVAVVTMTQTAFGWSRTLKALIIVAAITWGLEALGARTGFPFGSYHYTNRLQPQIIGVPLLIPFAWFMMLVPSWAVARLITGSAITRSYGPALFTLLSGAAMTAWDLFLDPQMVMWDFWRWELSGGLFGIPWSNYAGWLLTGMVATAVAHPFALRLPLRPLLLIYGAVWFLQTVGLALFWGQPGPALAGGFAMGGLLLAALRGRARSAPT
jgi:putative membrane protein